MTTTDIAECHLPLGFVQLLVHPRGHDLFHQAEDLLCGDRIFRDGGDSAAHVQHDLLAGFEDEVVGALLEHHLDESI